MPERSESATLAALRARIHVLEMSPAGVKGGVEAVSSGAPEVDAGLPWGGLARACVHEVVGEAPGVAEGFSAALAARLIEGSGPALWCLARGDLYGPGLGAFGLDPDRLIVARARNAGDVPWAMEEGLRSGTVGVVLGEVRALDLTAGRRLQLAAGAGGVTCLLLRPSGAAPAPGAAVTRWRVAPAPGLAEAGFPGLGAPRWRVGLERCRGGAPRAWLLEWDDEARHFTVVSVLGERAAGPAAAAQFARAG